MDEKLSPIAAAIYLKTKYTQNVTVDSWKANFCSFSVRASSGVWTPYLWLKQVSQLIIDGFANPDIDIVILNAPPRNGKSFTFTTYFPLWLMEKDITQRIMIVTYSPTLSKKSARIIRDTLSTNDELDTNVSKKASAVSFFETVDRNGDAHGGHLLAVSIRGGITGLGGDVIIIDDPTKNSTEAFSEAHNRELRDIFETSIMTRREPGAKMLFCGTRWNEKDFTAYLLKGFEGRCLHINLPALAMDDDILGRKKGQALCPERFDEKALEKIRNNYKDARFDVFSAMYQQQPKALSGNIIKDSWLTNHYYQEIDLSRFARIITSWDLTFGNTGASFMVGQVWGELVIARHAIDRSKDIIHYYLIEQVRRKLEYPDARDLTRATCKRYETAFMHVIENKANGAATISELKNEIKNMHPFNPVGSKEDRLDAVSPLFKDGCVFLPDSIIAEWVPDYVARLCSFPSVDFDDEIDTTSQALLFLRGDVKKSNAITINNLDSNMLGSATMNNDWGM